jgi:hypothetical protein
MNYSNTGIFHLQMLIFFNQINNFKERCILRGVKREYTVYFVPTL